MNRCTFLTLAYVRAHGGDLFGLRPSCLATYNLAWVCSMISSRSISARLAMIWKPSGWRTGVNGVGEASELDALRVQFADYIEVA
ncbi:hypothetical protein [Xylella taiwanensis]|nr:hypothetical protein AB672_10560 [Xylella taiwanensis]